MLQISNIHFTSFKTDEKKYQTLFVDFANLSNFGITNVLIQKPLADIDGNSEN
jgi:hypothetical protein